MFLPYSKWSIKSKLWLGLSTGLVLMLSHVALSYYFQQVVADGLSQTQQLSTATESVIKSSKLLADFFDEEELKTTKNPAELLEILKAKFEIVEQSLQTKEVQESVPVPAIEASEKFQEFKISISSFLIQRQNSSSNVDSFSLLILRQKYRDFEESMNALTSKLRKATQKSFKQTYRVRNQPVIMSLIMAGFLSLILLAFGRALVRRINRSVDSLVDAVARLSEGDLDARADVHSEDEIGTLATAFNSMTVQLKQAQEKELEYSRYIENVFLSLAEMVFVLDRDRNIEKVNPMVQHLLGFGSNSLIGTRFSDLLIAEDTASGEATIRTIETKVANEPNSNVEVVFRSATGEEIPCSLHAAYKDGGGMVFSAIDIREQKKLQARANQSERLASIGELAAGVGHEINNPLAILHGNMQILQKKMIVADEHSEKVAVMMERNFDSIERIKSIVDGLRVYARMDSNEDTVLNVHTLVKRTKNLVSAVYLKENIQLIVSLAASSHCVLGNEGKFQQMLMNFVSNARDAVSDNKDKIIEISTENVEDAVVLTVRDNGCGIPEKVRNKIFDAFFTTKPTGQGTGLGLGISLRIIKEMKGRVELGTATGVGTSFEITLPLAGEVVANEENNSQQAPEELPELSGQVLIVDDEEGIREILESIVEDLGFQVDLAEDGDVALSMIKKKHYDLVLSDMKMPNMQGDELVRHAKKILPSSTKFIIVTGGVTGDNKLNSHDGLSEIADGFLMKPFSDESVHKKIIEVFKGKDTPKAAG